MPPTRTARPPRRTPPHRPRDPRIRSRTEEPSPRLQGI